MLARRTLVFVISIVTMALWAKSTAPVRNAAPPLLYTVAPEYRPLAWMSGEERFPGGAQIFIAHARSRRLLVPGFVASADANVSFDGKKVLFAGKQRSGDHWQIWEMPLADRSLRQVTHCDDDCVRPFFVPPDQFVFAQKAAGRFVLEIASLGGNNEKILQLTYGPENYLATDVLHDGRILFGSAYRAGNGAVPELYTVYPDGSGVEAYRCDHGHARYAGRQLSSGDLVFVQDGGLFRFTSALADQVAVRPPPGNYSGDVVEMPDGTWLVSWQGARQKHFELREWKPGTSTLQPEVIATAANIIQPVLANQRPTPNIFPSGLHDWVYANVLCLNAYTSKYRFAKGSISAVRVYTRNASGETRLLGTAPVEKDGSFYVRVPGNQPLKFELADNAGNTLKKEEGWYWLRGGEQRACVGCHAGPETAPENAVPEVLVRSVVPADMTAGNSQTPTGGH